MHAARGQEGTVRPKSVPMSTGRYARTIVSCGTNASHGMEEYITHSDVCRQRYGYKAFVR
jgi:hypothetical protein